MAHAILYKNRLQERIIYARYGTMTWPYRCDFMARPSQAWWSVHNREQYQGVGDQYRWRATTIVPGLPCWRQMSLPRLYRSESLDDTTKPMAAAKVTFTLLKLVFSCNVDECWPVLFNYTTVTSGTASVYGVAIMTFL